MIEEFIFVLSHLHKNYNDGSLVLGHELLLLACSQCCRKRGGARGSRCMGPTSLDKLPACTTQTLECAVRGTDTTHLECLVWAVFDNIMGLGETPTLSRIETYQQIVGRLATKVYKGQHMCCPVHTSTSFGAEQTKAKSEDPERKKPIKSPSYFMTRDVREEFAGSYSTFKEKQDISSNGQSLAQSVDLNSQGMKWMKKCQCSYEDAQLDFWLLLRP